MNIPNPHATAANAPEITSTHAAVATKNNVLTLHPRITAIANGMAALTQNLNNLAKAVNATNANVNHLTAMINQIPAAGGGGGGPGGEVSGGPVPFALSPGCAKEDLVIDYCKKRGSSLYNAGKVAVATEFDTSNKNTVIFESELESKAHMMGWDSAT